MRRTCLKIQSGPAAVGFGGGQDGEAGASPRRAATAEPTPATAKRRAEGPLSIFRQALNTVNRVPAETDCPGWNLGKAGGESLTPGNCFTGIYFRANQIPLQVHFR